MINTAEINKHEKNFADRQQISVEQIEEEQIENEQTTNEQQALAIALAEKEQTEERKINLAARQDISNRNQNSATEHGTAQGTGNMRYAHIFAYLFEPEEYEIFTGSTTAQQTVREPYKKMWDGTLLFDGNGKQKFYSGKQLCKFMAFWSAKKLKITNYSEVKDLTLSSSKLESVEITGVANVENVSMYRCGKLTTVKITGAEYMDKIGVVGSPYVTNIEFAARKKINSFYADSIEQARITINGKDFKYKSKQKMTNTNNVPSYYSYIALDDASPDGARGAVIKI